LRCFDHRAHLLHGSVIAAIVTGAALGLIGIVMAFIGYNHLKKSIQKT